MMTEGHGYSALMLYNHLAREAEAERVERFYRDREKRRPTSTAFHQAQVLARPATAVKPTVPPFLAAERTRVLAIIAATPEGMEADRDEAIFSGMSATELKDAVNGAIAARQILKAYHAANSGRS